MDNKEIAKRVASICFKSHPEENDDFAVQLFVENVLISEEVDSYGYSELEKLIFDYLER